MPCAPFLLPVLTSTFLLRRRVCWSFVLHPLNSRWCCIIYSKKPAGDDDDAFASGILIDEATVSVLITRHMYVGAGVDGEVSSLMGCGLLRCRHRVRFTSTLQLTPGKQRRGCITMLLPSMVSAADAESPQWVVRIGIYGSHHSYDADATQSMLPGLSQ